MNTQLCPECKIPVEKTRTDYFDNLIECVCGTEWCWECMYVFENMNPRHVFKHFNDYECILTPNDDFYGDKEYMSYLNKFNNPESEFKLKNVPVKYQTNKLIFRAVQRAPRNARYLNKSTTYYSILIMGIPESIRFIKPSCYSDNDVVSTLKKFPENIVLIKNDYYITCLLREFGKCIPYVDSNLYDDNIVLYTIAQHHENVKYLKDKSDYNIYHAININPKCIIDIKNPTPKMLAFYLDRTGNYNVFSCLSRLNKG